MDNGHGYIFTAVEGKLYKKKSCMPMGSPLSPVLADLVMERFVDKVIKFSNSVHQKIC